MSSPGVIDADFGDAYGIGKLALYRRKQGEVAALLDGALLGGSDFQAELPILLHQAADLVDLALARLGPVAQILAQALKGRVDQIVGRKHRHHRARDLDQGLLARLHALIARAHAGHVGLKIGPDPPAAYGS